MYFLVVIQLLPFAMRSGWSFEILMEAWSVQAFSFADLRPM